MSTETIERTVTGTSAQEQSTAEFNGWTLNFTAQSEAGAVKSVSVYGSKGTESVSASINEQGYINVGFGQGGRDSALLSALMDELEAMVA